MKNIRAKIAWIWQNMENVLIVLFFLTFTFNIRKVFLTPYSFLNGGFNEYMTFSLSWADVLMIVVILIYTIKYIISQYNNRSTLSTLSYSHVSRKTFFLVLFLGWAGLSIFWSQYQSIAVYKFLTLIEIALFAFVVAKSLKNLKWLEIGLFAVILNGLFQSILGIAQFIHNSSLGIRVFGESILGPNIDGVAKIIIDGEKHTRAYGTFPHPNILAGFLIVPLFMILSELLSTPSQPSPYQEEGWDGFPLLTEERARVRFSIVPRETLLSFIPRWFLLLSFLITALGFVLTFSRSAFLGFFIGLVVFILWIKYTQFIKWRINSKYVIALFVLLIVIIFFLLKYTSFLSSQSMEERNLYKNVSHETILSHPIGGVGIGQSVINTYYGHSNLEGWQYQPVHNVYLLIFSELGSVGFSLFLLFLISLFWNMKQRRNNTVLRLTNTVLRCIILSFLVISFFDHYFWDIKIGTLVFVLPIILFVVKTKN